jgi:Inhibitor of Apoptosis domain
VFCKLEVRGWERGDTADGEHRRWNPNCFFLNNPLHADNIQIGEEVIYAENNQDVCGRKPIPSFADISPFIPDNNLSKCEYSYINLQIKQNLFN